MIFHLLRTLKKRLISSNSSMTNNSALCTDPVQFSKKKVYPPTFDIKRKMNLYYTLLMCETNTFFSFAEGSWLLSAISEFRENTWVLQNPFHTKSSPWMKPTFRNSGCSRQKSPPLTLWSKNWSIVIIPEEVKPKCWYIIFTICICI